MLKNLWRRRLRYWRVRLFEELSLAREFGVTTHSITESERIARKIKKIQRHLDV